MNFGGADDGSPVPMPQAPADLIGLICLVLGVLVGLLTALAIAIYMRLSGSTGAPLSLLFIPLWLLDLIGLVLLYTVLFASARKGDTSGPAGMSLMLLLLYLTFQILLVLRVDGSSPTLAWSLICIPLYVAEAIYTVQAVARCRPSAYEAEKAAAHAAGSTLSYSQHVTFILSYAACRLATLVLAVLKLDGQLMAPWSLIFVPVYVYLGFCIYSACADAPPKGDTSSESQQLKRATGRLSIGGSIFAMVLLSLLVLILDGQLSSWFPLFILPFTFAGCFCCCCCCVLCSIRSMPKPEPVDVPLEEDSEAPSTYRSGPASSSRSDPPTPSEDDPLLSGSERRAGRAFAGV